MHPHPFEIAPIARHIWETKYRLTGDAAAVDEDVDVDATWRRIASAAAQPESDSDRGHWERAFYDAMADLAFLPAGRIIAGAGSGRAVTLFNCFVMGTIADDLGAIFDNVKEAALTMQQGGGIGHDFSTLRPRGAPVSTLGADASGPVSFMDVWDAMCRTIMSAGARRGAMMGTMRCDHPDIELFVTAKTDPDRLRNFNLSVLVTDDFINAVRTNADWPLQFDGKVYRTVSARALWDRIMRATYDVAEPGVIFIDRINAANNLAYCEHIQATNPCGEQPLPPYGACLLGSLNLARLVIAPFSPDARIDTARLEDLTATGVRLLDNIIDISRYPLEAQQREARSKRRIGLGVTGLADALVMCGVRYGSPEAAALAGGWMRTIQNGAYLASSRLATAKGAFPLFDGNEMLQRPNIERLDTPVRKAIATAGLRNGCLTSIAPTGTISLLAGNVSSGIEPIFELAYQRRILDRDGEARQETVEDYAHALFRREFVKGGEESGAPPSLPDTFVTARSLSPSEHLAMQAAIQPWVDSSISKTINCPSGIDFDAFKSVYLDAYDLGLKGCTTYRPNPVTGAVLTALDAPPEEEPADTGTKTSATPVRSATRSDEAPQSTGSSSGNIVFMTKPLEREAALQGFTYKLKWPGSPDALYVTINDIIRDGRRVPFEIFINTKNLEHYAWTVALTRMISAVFRRGGDVAFVVEELKAIFDPQGGRWIDGRYVPSLLAAIGEVIEGHMVRIGFLPSDDTARAEALIQSGSPVGEAGALPHGRAPNLGRSRPERVCPQCGNRRMRQQEGCWTCATCGYSKCN
ncbi:MAG: adenosylcobalamin-dependent ribonucleoside-diphosphate reductase [Hyphomicrobiaceae bacterium]|nr:adenosylcobalamin-dependent ribonucleoside-diphosphate reductase [Hyphomicrobiaceae bacterium]